jgi:glutaminase
MRFTRKNSIGTTLLAFALTVALIATVVPQPAYAQATAAAKATGQRSPVAPTKEQVQAVVNEAYQKFKSNTDGKNADYIPALAEVDPKLFGVVIVATDGQVVTAGDIDHAFSIQSISKVFSLALAMEELGAEQVFEKIGSEPTGRPFNSVEAVVDMPTHTGNAFVNAGAIATVSLIPAPTADAKWNKILAFYSKAAGDKLTLLQDVYKSEAATNTGNKALAALLLKYERIYADTLESVDVYTKQCSVGVNAKQLAVMGATLANNGINPLTGEQVIKRENVPEILSAMTMAGLYDGSGGWAWKVGLPAKSGVGGGIVAVVPGKGAIAVFAPPLDKAGNSVKAQLVIDYVAEQLGINLFSPRSVGLK